MGIIEQVRRGNITDELDQIAQIEGVSLQYMVDMVSEGKIVIPHNPRHKLKYPCAIGKGLSIKVNANIGTSPTVQSLSYELEKLRVAQRAQADTIMDLSCGGDLDDIRRNLLRECDVPFGTVPIYQAACLAIKEGSDIAAMTKESIFEVIERHMQDGVDFMTIHAGLRKEDLRRLHNKRVMGIVSRGGSILAHWMEKNDCENPLYEYFSDILELARRYDVVLSLGDSLRSGTIEDSKDDAQIRELLTLSEMAKYAVSQGVQTIIEGPGHLPLNQIMPIISLQKKISNEIPYYLLGPVVTDIAAGYDHIAGAIGAAIAGYSGADFICYVTPAEHLHLPGPDDVREGVIAARIAAHAADLAKNLPKHREREFNMSKARAALNWSQQKKFAIDSEKFDRYHYRDNEVCSMCGPLCAIKLSKNYVSHTI